MGVADDRGRHPEARTPPKPEAPDAKRIRLASARAEVRLLLERDLCKLEGFWLHDDLPCYTKLQLSRDSSGVDLWTEVERLLGINYMQIALFVLHQRKTKQRRFKFLEHRHPLRHHLPLGCGSNGEPPSLVVLCVVAKGCDPHTLKWSAQPADEAAAGLRHELFRWTEHICLLIVKYFCPTTQRLVTLGCYYSHIQEKIEAIITDGWLKERLTPHVERKDVAPLEASAELMCWEEFMSKRPQDIMQRDLKSTVDKEGLYCGDIIVLQPAPPGLPTASPHSEDSDEAGADLDADDDAGVLTVKKLCAKIASQELAAQKREVREQQEREVRERRGRRDQELQLLPEQLLQASRQVQELVAARSEHDRREQELLEQLEASRQELAAARKELVVARREMRAQREQELAAARRELSWAIAASLPLPRCLCPPSYELQLLAPTDPIHGWLAEIFLASCTRHRKDLRSPEFCDAPRLHLERVEVVVNPHLLRAYSNKAEEIQRLRHNGCGSIPILAHLKVPPRKGAAPNWPDLNEHFLFHGATEDVLAEISRSGFEPQRGGEATGRMFGVATYLAVNASKADIYTDRAQRTSRQARRKMLIARALLGESHRAAETMPHARRPPNGSDGRPLDSVWADKRENGGAVDHLEVMLYKEGQAYPEFLVSYTHLPECRCAECGHRPASDWA